MQTYPLVLSALVLVGSLSACTTEATPTAPVVSGASQSQAPSTDAPAVGDPAAVLEIEDQVSKGPTVNVKAAAVTKGGWVVVASEGGRNVLGAGMVPAGTTATLVQVSLAEIITEPTELVARLYQDDVADGLYGVGDKPVGNGDKDDDDTGEGEVETFTFTGEDVR